MAKKALTMGITDAVFNDIVKALHTNNKQWENGRLKYHEMYRQREQIFRNYPVSKDDFYAELRKRVEAKKGITVPVDDGGHKRGEMTVSDYIIDPDLGLKYTRFLDRPTIFEERPRHPIAPDYDIGPDDGIDEGDEDEEQMMPEVAEEAAAPEEAANNAVQQDAPEQARDNVGN
jgi:hypothetical protein